MRKSLDLVKHRWTFIIISLVIIVPGVIFILIGGLRASIDFTGGSSWDINFAANKVPDNDAIQNTMKDADTQFISTLRNKPNKINSEIDLLAARDKQAFESVAQRSDNGLVVIRTSLIAEDTGEKTAIVNALQTKFAASNGFVADKYDVTSTSPTVSGEVTTRSILAVVVASFGILFYLAYAFRRVKRPWRYGVCAILAMLHDVLVVLGIFAILGFFLKVEIDSLFVTALLTVIGFSVHDSIVVFDRIRENEIRNPGEEFASLVNHSLVQTLVRSLNTSLTVIFTLSALYLFGGITIHYFVLALLVGIISGTYSSIFNASMLLVIWEKGEFGRFIGRKPKSHTPVPTIAVAR